MVKPLTISLILIKKHMKLKNLFFRHFTIVNLLVGLIVLIMVGLIKYFGVALLFIKFFSLEPTEFNEYIITGVNY